MRKRLWTILLVTALAWSCGGGENDSYTEYFPPDSNPYDQSYADWAIRWWEWALSFPQADHPIENDAFDCTQGQSGPVWFLAGHGARATPPVTRECTMPSGRAIFFPIINSLTHSCPEIWGELDCEYADPAFLDNSAEAWLEFPVRMEVEVDGESIPNLERFATISSTFHYEYTSSEPSWLWHPQCTDPPDCLPVEDFDCILPWEDGNVCGELPGLKYFITPGYWVMVEPLDTGEHTIRIHAIMNPTDPWFELDVTYNLNVTE